MKTRLLLLLALAALLLGLFATGAFDRLDAGALRSWIRDARVFGPLLFVLVFSALQPLGFPGLIFMLTAIAVWPAWQAWLLIWAGTVGAGVVGYALARALGREWVMARLPERLRRLDGWVAAHALFAVILARLLFFLFPPAHWALGLTRVSLPTLVLGSALGFAPGTALFAFAGAELGGWLAKQPRETWAVLLAALLAVVLGVRRLRARRVRIDATS